jgi:hypothetical protein
MNSSCRFDASSKFSNQAKLFVQQAVDAVTFVLPATSGQYREEMLILSAQLFKLLIQNNTLGLKNEDTFTTI